MKVSLRPATKADFFAFHNRPMPPFWCGLVITDGRIIRGIGGVYLSQDYGFVVSMQAAPGISVSKTQMHRCVKAMMAALKASDIDVVHAAADNRIEVSGAYLERLGFQPTAHFHEGHRIYQWRNLH